VPFHLSVRDCRNGLDSDPTAKQLVVLVQDTPLKPSPEDATGVGVSVHVDPCNVSMLVFSADAESKAPAATQNEGFTQETAAS
jgi:hypothetical protein